MPVIPSPRKSGGRPTLAPTRRAPWWRPGAHGMVEAMRQPLVLLAAVGLAACPALFGNGGSGDRCSETADCGSSLVCVRRECSTPYGWKWRLTVERVRVAQHTPSGGDWDGDGTPPDPYVVIKVDDVQLLRTQTRENTSEATWTESISFVLNSGTRVQVEVWDDDFLVPEGIAATPNASVGVTELRAGRMVAYTAAAGDAGSGEISSIAYVWDVAE